MKEHFKVISLNAEAIAESLGSSKCANVVLFGAMVKPLGLDNINWEEVIKRVVPEKFIDLNLAAYKAGMAAAEKM